MYVYGILNYKTQFTIFDSDKLLFLDYSHTFVNVQQPFFLNTAILLTRSIKSLPDHPPPIPFPKTHSTALSSPRTHPTPALQNSRPRTPASASALNPRRSDLIERLTAKHRPPRARSLSRARARKI